jgi:hypothetical protein
MCTAIAPDVDDDGGCGSGGGGDRPELTSAGEVGGGGGGEDCPAAAVAPYLVYRGCPPMLVQLARLPPDCKSSANALRFLSRDSGGGNCHAPILPCTSHPVVMLGMC